VGYSPVYSTPFIEYTPSTPNNSFDVPDGATAIIRQITCVQNVGGYALSTYIQNSGAAPALLIDYEEGIGINVVYQKELRVVCVGGGIITVDLTAVGTAVSVYVGGYLLTNNIA
jgi:hypothetical protein